MTSTNEQFLDYLCRTCMHELIELSQFKANSTTEQQWQSIFDTIEACGSIQIAELLTNTVPQLEVHLHDKLPKKICSKCLQHLLSANHFQQMCLESDQQMRALFAKKSTDLKESIMEAVKDEINANIFLKQELVLNPNENRIEFDHINALPELTEAVDPLQNIEVVMGHGKDELGDLTLFVKNDRDKEQHAMASAKSKSLKVETGGDKKQTQSLHNGELDKNLKMRVCDICGKVYYKSSSLRTHKRRCHPTETPKSPLKTPLLCDMCNEKCSTRSELAKHKRLLHSFKKPQKTSNEHPCDLCNETYITRTDLANHKKLSHSTEQKQHSCYLCGKNFQKRKSLKEHIRRHKGERPFLCPQCGKSFCDSGGLKQHVLRHRGERSYECPYCPSRFLCPNDVANHKIIHEGIKRHVCDICGYRFGTSSQLVMHKKWHNNDKPYKCDCCEMRFVRMTAQRRHMITHTGEKPYKCKYCGRAYTQNNDLMKHLRIHLGDNVYRCKICPLAFPSGKEMRSHFLTHKNEDPETRERNMKALMEEEAKWQLKFTESAKQLQKQVEAKITE